MRSATEKVTSHLDVALKYTEAPTGRGRHDKQPSPLYGPEHLRCRVSRSERISTRHNKNTINQQKYHPYVKKQYYLHCKHSHKDNRCVHVKIRENIPQ